MVDFLVHANANVAVHPGGSQAPRKPLGPKSIAPIFAYSVLQNILQSRVSKKISKSTVSQALVRISTDM